MNHRTKSTYLEITRMKFHIRIWKAIATGLTLLFISVSTSAFAVEGKALFMSQGCEGCHGSEGTGSVGPRLAAQQEKYLIAQFKLIRDEQRTSGLSSMMSSAVKNVSDDDINAIAAYLSGLK